MIYVSNLGVNHDALFPSGDVFPTKPVFMNQKESTKQKNLIIYYYGNEADYRIVMLRSRPDKL